MKVIDTITLPAFAGARPTITRYRGVDYVYLLEKTSNVVRYSVENGMLKLDTSWTPAPIPYPNQTTGGSVIVMNDWIVGATNTIPAAGQLTMFAINQSDAAKVLLLQPYVEDPVPPELSKAFATAAAGGVPAISWADMSLEADPENGLVYGVDTLKRKVAAFKVTSSGIETVWKKRQTTTEWATLIGPKNERVWVGTDIPGAEIPGQNKTETIVFRELLRGAPLVDMGFGTHGPGEDAAVLEPSLMLVPLAAFDARGHRIGYGAGYYSYLWSDTLSSDAYEAFTEAKGPYDKDIAAKLKKNVFSAGNTVDPVDGYRAFRGKDAGIEALMRKRGFAKKKK